jgi:transposase
MDAREQRGIIIAAMYKIDRKNGAWLVPSQSNPDKKYKVNLEGEGSCDCPDCQESGQVCKHIRAVRITLKRELGMDGSIVETKSITFEEKKTYKQPWAQYNLSQCEEKHRFQVLLHDLCNGVKEPELSPLGGRPPILLCDRLFSVIFKVYSTIASRRFDCDLADAHAAGYLTRKPHWNRVNAFLESESLTATLQSLVAQSSTPLRAIESDFAVDSTGFSVARHVRWVDEKYGVKRSGRDWVKIHVVSGVATNIVTAAAIYGRDANDCPIMPELLKETAKTFKLRDVSADKGYLSADNIESVFALGATPFIQFKVNTTGGVGGLFQKMFHFYQFNRDEFLARYHQRSNVESTFSAIKRRFGDYLRSRTDVAMKNEALAKIVAYNVCCVIASQCELGIEPVFWSGESAALPTMPD